MAGWPVQYHGDESNSLGIEESILKGFGLTLWFTHPALNYLNLDLHVRKHKFLSCLDTVFLVLLFSETFMHTDYLLQNREVWALKEQYSIAQRKEL